ncbi:MAG TPA: asparagine synthase (glutamine-hydrolyzing), partial [Polyangiaceae bacterium]
MDSALVQRLNDLQRHRGPDGEGLWSSFGDRIVLGHRRLAIIDLGETGAQPMSDFTGRWTITFNGEIYNYRQVRAELEAHGRRFHTNSDTEVLINAVATWGAEGLRKVRGMFAFALWDDREKELWLARDPYGIKPLHFGESGGTLWFASQARPLSNVAPLSARRDAAALTAFYLWGYVPEPFTWWADIRMLPAGHVLRVRTGKPLVQSEPFFSLVESYLSRPPAPIEAGELRAILLDSVRHHLVADTPVGIFLSAGIDSNVIAALAAEAGTDLRTVTLAFDEYRGTADDEAPLAEATAKVLGSHHTTVRMGREEFESLIDDYFMRMDMPSTDGLNTYLVSHATAKQGLKVVLSGLGGDELFGGYPSFRQIPQLLKIGCALSFAGGLGRDAERLIRLLPAGLIQPKVSGLLRYSSGIENAYFFRRALHLEADLGDLLDESWYKPGLEQLLVAQTLSHIVEPLRTAHASTHAQIAALESCWYMRNQPLRDTDWASMAHGLEVRVPFVDADVLERLGPAVASVRPPTKADLSACSSKLSPLISARPKTGFTTPIRSWIARDKRAPARGLYGWAEQVHQQFRKADARAS